jgi:hypothetical protein
MNPLLAITAAKAGSKFLNNLAGNQPAAKTSEADVKKAAFAKMLAQSVSTPKYQHTQALGSKGISSREDATSTVQQLSHKILECPEVAKHLPSSDEPYSLEFLKDGSVCIHRADGSKHTVPLTGAARESALESMAILQSVKVAFPGQSGDAMDGIRLQAGLSSSLLC